MLRAKAMLPFSGGPGRKLSIGMGCVGRQMCPVAAYRGNFNTRTLLADGVIEVTAGNDT